MKVALVVGHSQKSQGARNATYGVSEFEFNRKLAHDIEREWSEHNMSDEIVVVYRETYEALPHQINALGVDLVVSLHANAFDTKTRGCEMLYYHASKPGKIVATIFQERIFGVLQTIDRGVKPKHSEDRGGYLLRTTHAPCIICEPFFIDNDADLLEADALFDSGMLTTMFCISINESLQYLRGLK